jgi:hypothetical protein
MSEDLPAWRRGQLGKSGRREKLRSLHDDGLYYWKPGVLCYFITVSFGRNCLLLYFFFGRSYGHFRRRRGGNWLENLAKHRARRLVYYVLLSVREEIDCSESTEIARGGHDTPKTREAMEP